MDPKGKGIVINDKEKESFVNEPRDDKSNDSGSGHRRKDGKKKKTRRIKEIIYYDDSDESTSSQKDDDHNDYERRKPVNSNFSFDYSRILQSTNTHLLSIPLGKPPHFDGEDYGFWSHKMRSPPHQSVEACREEWRANVNLNFAEYESSQKKSSN